MTRLDNKIALVTGANRGIGFETTVELARRGATVVMACRSMRRAAAAKELIIDTYGEEREGVTSKHLPCKEVASQLTPIKPSQLVLERVDLASFESVRNLAQRIIDSKIAIDFLINNAGVMACPYFLTVDGHELQMQVNHLGPFLLTNLILASLKKAEPPGRVINVSAISQKLGKIYADELSMSKRKYQSWQAFRNSKLASVAFAKGLAQREAESKIIAVSLHPGAVKSDQWKGGQKFYSGIAKPMMKSPWEGTQTTLYCVLASDLQSGAFYADCMIKNGKTPADDQQLVDRVWDLSLKAVGLAPDTVQEPKMKDGENTIGSETTSSEKKEGEEVDDDDTEYTSDDDEEEEEEEEEESDDNEKNDDDSA